MREHDVEVVVVGAGIVGASAAWQLARRGIHVAVVEQFELDHVRGSSHGASRIFRLAYDTLDYVHLAEMALPLWRQAEVELGSRLLWTTGGLDVGPPERLLPVTDALTAAGVRFERLGRAEMGQRFPAYALPTGWEALYQADTGVLHADSCRLGLLDLARRSGANVRPRTAVVELQPEGESVTLETSDGSLHARYVLVAAAGWANRLLRPLDLTVPMKVTREHVAYFRCPPAAHVVPFIWHTDSGPFEFYGLPNARNDRVKAGEHGAGPEVDPDSEPGVEPDRVAAIKRFVREHLPDLDPEPELSETCLYATTPDDDFVLDRCGPVILGVGFGGHGFKFGPVLGSMLADLIEGKRIRFAERFRYARFETPVSSGP